MYESVIGLEVHLAVRTDSKLFCGCNADGFGKPPNSCVCPTCLGLPGRAPRLNREAVAKALMFSLALQCEVPRRTEFQRKHYFYPDAPKNYQTSQGEGPIGENGRVTLANGRTIRIARCHLEEDAGRSVHPPYAGHSLIDLNRAGAPLIEMVTEPDIRSAQEAREFLGVVRAIAQALGVSDASPEEGKMRADVNISVNRSGEPFGTKVEVKNLNSFRSVEAAIEYEFRRQRTQLDDNKPITQQTRGWNEGGQRTYLMREKEESADYRYLPDPELPALEISRELLEEIRQATPELPGSKEARYQALGLREAHAALIAFDVGLASFFDASLKAAEGSGIEPQAIANWLVSEVTGHLNELQVGLDEVSLKPAAFVELVGLVEDGKISGRTAKELLPEVVDGAAPSKLVEERGLVQISDEAAVASLVDSVIEGNPELVERVRQNPKAINALLGLVMKESRGKAKPDLVRRLLTQQLEIE